jgi:small subunit ribosomal protein S20
MPQRKSGIDELRKSQKRRLRNLDIKTDLKKTVKKYLVSVKSENPVEAQDNLKLVYKKLDKAVKRDILKKNTASRRKSTLTKLLTKTA